MSLSNYFRILIRRGWIMLLLAIIAAGSAYYFSKQETPVYRSTQKVLIQPSRTDFGLTEASRLLLNSLVVYLDSEAIAAEIIEDLHLDMTAGQLKSNVTIAPDQLRLVIQIDVDHADGDVANDIAWAWAQYLVNYRNEANATVRREDRVLAIPVDTPRYSQKSPKPALNGVAGGILGLIIGGVVVFVLEYLESNIIRRREDMERILDVPVLALIPDFDN